MGGFSAMFETFKKLIQDESGATAIEYGLLAGLISIVIIVAVTSAGEALDLIFTTVATTLQNAAGG
jgi:pilus assembly protein Flp/PilA